MMNKKLNIVIAFAALMLQANNVIAQLKLANGATIFVSTGATLAARGNITNDGAITGSGITLLDGSSLQGIVSSSVIQYHIELQPTEIS